MRSEMVFLMGLPAAGKTTTASVRYDSTFTRIDPDAIKVELPGYTPERAPEFHEASKAIADLMFGAALASGEGCYIIDGTGTNAESMVHKIRQAQDAGFTATLCYVTCSLETSLRRAALRDRKVPASVIVEKATTIATSFEIVSMYANNVIVIDNDVDTSTEAN